MGSAAPDAGSGEGRKAMFGPEAVAEVCARPGGVGGGRFESGEHSRDRQAVELAVVPAVRPLLRPPWPRLPMGTSRLRLRYQLSTPTWNRMSSMPLLGARSWAFEMWCHRTLAVNA